MSSAGRGPRGGYNRGGFPTPPWAVRLLAKHWQPPPGLILEPHAGCGSIIRAWPVPRRWVAVEPEPRCWPHLEAIPSWELIRISRRSFSDWIDLAEPLPSAAIDNPPFDQIDAELPLLRSLRIPCAVLLRMGVLADSEERIERWGHVDRPHTVLVVGRIDFETADMKAARRAEKAARLGVAVEKVPLSGGDSSLYAWYIWGSEGSADHPRLITARRPPAAERKERGIAP